MVKFIEVETICTQKSMTHDFKIIKVGDRVKRKINIESIWEYGDFYIHLRGSEYPYKTDLTLIEVDKLIEDSKNK